MLNKIIASVLLLLATIALTTKCHQLSFQRNQDLNLHGIDSSEPEFLGNIQNVTNPAGREATLICTIANIGINKVAWLRASDQTVLVLHDKVVGHHNRMTITHEDFTTWRLRIKQLRESDRGCYRCQVNTKPMKQQEGCIDVQVPPDIITEDSSSDVAVLEGEDATLTCRATGNPTPRVMWKKEDGDSILVRKLGSREYREMQRVDTYNGSQLRLTRLERKQMGAYLCIASNDVPPSISKRVSLSIHFAPTILAESQLLGAPYGSNVHMRCHVEASPTPVVYWLRGSRSSNESKRSNSSSSSSSSSSTSTSSSSTSTSWELGQSKNEMLLDGPKYSITDVRNSYKGDMLLIIKSFAPNDVGTYHCVSTNSLGKAEGTIRVYGIAEAARGRAKSSANSLQLMATKTAVLLLTSLGVFLTTSHTR